MEDVTSELPIQIDGKLNNWFMVASVINKEKVQRVQKTFWSSGLEWSKILWLALNEK